MEWSLYESVPDIMSYLPKYLAFQECSIDFISFNSSKCILAHLFFYLKFYFFFKYTKLIQAVSTQHSGYGELEEESSVDGMRYKHMFWDAVGYMHICTCKINHHGDDYKLGILL